MKLKMKVLITAKTMALAVLMIGLSAASLNNTVEKTETLKFDIKAFDMVVGQLDVMKVTYGESVYYSSKTKVDVDVVKTIKVLFDFDVNFSNGKMLNSTIKASVNGDVYTNTLTKKEDNVYHVYKEGKKTKEITEEIDFATIQLYFEEPENITRCYAEQQGSFNTITSFEEHSYKMKNEKGRVNKYYFENGALKKAILDSGLKEFQIVAKQHHQ